MGGTNLRHGFQPILWKDHGEILYITSINGNRVEWLDLRRYERALQEQEDNDHFVDLTFTAKWGFVTRDGNVEYKKGYGYLKDKRSTLSYALNTNFPKDCCVT